jgi:K+-sensing histidine kinase KdpD
MYENLTALINRLRLEIGLRFPFLIPKKRDGIYAYLLTIVLMGVALFVRLAIAPVSAGVQYVTFFPSVTLAAIFGGYKSGMLATVIGLILATYIFTPPYYLHFD